MLDREIANTIRELLAGYPELMLAYLFGSQAGGHTGPLSDHDFGVLLRTETDPLALRSRLAHELGAVLATDRVDVVVLNRAPVDLAFAVISQGVQVFQRDEATRVEYEARVMGLYGDYLPVLRAQRADIYRGADHANRVQRYREALGRTEREIGEIRAAQVEDSR